MRRTGRWLRCVVLVWALLLFCATAQAQFTADHQTNIVSAVVSNWSWASDYDVGSSNAFDLLQIENGGMLSDYGSTIGYQAWASNNSVVVDGIGSVWTNTASLTVGYGSSGNQLVISGGGAVYAPWSAWIGSLSGSSNNVVLVSGSGSVWNIGVTWGSNDTDLVLGAYGSGNSLVISNGGSVVEIGSAGMSYQTFGGENNRVLVTGSGSTWSNDDISVGQYTGNNGMVISGGGAVACRSYFELGGYWSWCSNNTTVVSDSNSLLSCTTLIAGNSGVGNQLTITNGGAVFSDAGFIGYSSSSSNNTVLVSGSGSIWSNAFSLIVGELGSSNRLVISDGAVVDAPSGSAVGDINGPTFNNCAVVTGNGSVWSTSSLDVGGRGTGNSLIVSNGGVVDCTDASLGGPYPDTSNNTVTVVGNGSLFQSSGSIYVNGGGNQLTVGDGGSVVASNVALFSLWGQAGNAINVLDGSLNVSNGSMIVPQAGVGTLAISNGIVQAQDIILANLGAGTEGILTLASGSLLVQSGMVVGYGGCSTTGTVVITGGTCAVANAAHSAVLEVRSGTLTQTGGALLIDSLVITNDCGRFIHTGGALSITTTNLDPNLSAVGDGIPNGWKLRYGLDPFDPNLASEDADGDGMSNLQEYLAGTDPTNSASVLRIASLVPQGSDVLLSWSTARGHTNVVQAAPGPGGSYSNISPNIIISGSGDATTNYLDPGALTNGPARFYRIALVP